MRSLLAGLIVLLLSGTGAAQTPNYAGTYVHPTSTDPITLVLVQEASGKITGTWTATGTVFQVNGLLHEGAALGTVAGQTGGMYFAAVFDGPNLVVTVMEPDANNRPNPDRAQSLTFTRQRGGPERGAAPSPAGPPQVAARPPVAPSPPEAMPQPGGASQSVQGWNIGYTVPDGWRVAQTIGRARMLASTTEAGAIFVSPGLYSSFNEMVADLSRFYQSMNLTATPVEQPSQTTIAGLQALTATYMSQDQRGEVVHGRYIALLTPHGTGFAVLGLTTPQQMPKLAGTAERLAASVQARAPEVNQQAVAALAGRWMYYAGRAEGVTRSMGGFSHSSEEFVTFDGRGGFQWQSSASVSVTAPQDAGAAGRAQANSDQGSYTVIGSTLVVKGNQGQLAFELQLLGDRFSADGRVYLRSN